MKKIVCYLLILSIILNMMVGFCFNKTFVFADDGVAINEENFPDDIFREYVRKYDNIDCDGYLSDKEIQSVNEMFNPENGGNLKGIEFFTAITELSCSNSSLISLDVSKNYSLAILSCYNNSKLTDLKVNNNLKILHCGNNQLTTLDVSNNSNLIYIDCTNNQLTSLDVRGDINLEALYCDFNQLTNLDINDCDNLMYLGYARNKITDIDIENKNDLKRLNCSYNSIKTLDIDDNLTLEELNCEGNQLTSLDVSNNLNLKELNCEGNQLTSLDVSNNLSLEELYCYNNQLIELDVSNNIKLVDLFCYDNQLKSLDLGDIKELGKIGCENNKIRELDVSKQEKLGYLGCYNNYLKKLDITNNINISSCYCFDNCFQSFDVSNVKAKNVNFENINSDYVRAFLYGEITQHAITLEDQYTPPKSKTDFELWGGEYEYNSENHTINFSKWKEDIIDSNSLKINKNLYYSTDDYDDYIVCKNAVITVGNQCIKSDEFGTALIDSYFDETITVSKDGYITRSFTQDQLFYNTNINLQKVNDNGPVISGVWIGNIDVYNSKFNLSLTEDNIVDINVEIDWGKSEYGRLQLVQNEKYVDFNEKEENITINLNEFFDLSEDIYIYAKDINGHSTKRKLNFMLDNLDPDVVGYMDSLDIKFGDKLKFNLPSILTGGEVSLSGLEAPVPVEVCAEDGKISVLVGFKAKKYKNDNGKTKVTSVKDDIDIFIKDLKKSNSFDDIKNKYKDKYDASIVKSNFVFEADCNVAGYLEGIYYIENGIPHIKWNESSVCLNPSISQKYSIPFMFVGTPMFFEEEFKAEIEAKINLFEIIDSFGKYGVNNKFVPEGNIDADISIKAGLGVGANKVLSASGGGKGSMKLNWNINGGNTDYAKLMFSLKTYIKATILGLTYKKEFGPYYEKTIFEYPDTAKNPLNTVGDEIVKTINSEVTDEKQYKKDDLSYLNNESFFYSDIENQGLQQSDNSNTNIYDLKTNIYQQSKVQIVNISENNKFAVWLDSDGSDLNNVKLYYSVEQNGLWSEPKVVYDNGTMDYYPVLKLINGQVYIAWMDLSSDINDSAEILLDDISKNVDITVATYNCENDEFSINSFDNNGYDYMPNICADKENCIYVTWVNNLENNVFDNNNNIVCVKYDGNNWNVPKVIYTDVNYIYDYDICYDDELNIYYVVDGDKDLSTVDCAIYKNNELYYYAGDIVDNIKCIDGNVFWNSHNGVVNKNMLDSEINMNNNIADYEIISIAEKKYLFYTETDGIKSKLFMSPQNLDLSWGNGVELTDGSFAIPSFSVITDSNNKISILLNRQEVIENNELEEEYGESNLSMIKVNDICDLAVTDVCCNNSDYAVDKSIYMNYSFSNNGTVPVNAYTVTVKTTDNSVLYNQTVNKNINVGEKINGDIWFKVDQLSRNQKVVLLIQPLDMQDNISDNNQYEVQLDDNLLNLKNLRADKNELSQTIIHFDVYNYYKEDVDNIKVAVFDSYDGTESCYEEDVFVERNNITPIDFIINDRYETCFVKLVNMETGEIIDEDFLELSDSKININPSIQYKTQVQSIGWEDNYVSDGATSGTVGKAKRLEAIRIKLVDENGNTLDSSYGSVEYRTHVQKNGWEKSFVKDDALSGTVGKALRLEAVQIRLSGDIANDYDVYYRVQAEKLGWLGWAKNGEESGSAGYGYRLEAIQIKLVKKGKDVPVSENNLKPFYDKNKIPVVAYKTQVQTFGWEKAYVKNGATSGTVGKAKRLEAIQIKISNNKGYSGGIKYKTHVQKLGWQNYVSDGFTSGTVGKGYRLEAIQIELTGDIANYFDVYYRVQAQKFGWMGWAKNGISAGTAGYGYRLEAIQIQLVHKGTVAPGSTSNCFKKK